MGEYGFFELEYIRTDKNGTKIYLDNNCPRCCGYGELEQWDRTGRRCFACGGTGKRRKPRTVKIYTPEYLEKLEKRRLEREKKEAREKPSQTEDERRKAADTARRNIWQSEGMTREGVGYAYFGDTYQIKDELKRAGARWNRFLRGWIAPVSPSEIPGTSGIDVRCVKITAEKYAGESGYLDMDKMIELGDGRGKGAAL